jgi:hypothetical protein
MTLPWGFNRFKKHELIVLEIIFRWQGFMKTQMPVSIEVQKNIVILADERQSALFLPERYPGVAGINYC